MGKTMPTTFWGDLKKSIPSFILVGILGGGLTCGWQILNYKFQNSVAQRNYEKEAATKLFEENSRLLDQMLVDFDIYVVYGKDSASCTSDYKNWKTNITGHKALVEKYYGELLRDSLEKIDAQITYFYEVNLFSKDTMGIIDKQSDLNGLKIPIYKFHCQTIESLLKDSIGSYLAKGK